MNAIGPALSTNRPAGSWKRHLDVFAPFTVLAGLFLFLLYYFITLHHVVPKPLYAFPPAALENGKQAWTLLAMKDDRLLNLSINDETTHARNMLPLGTPNAPDFYIFPLDEPYPDYLNLSMGFILEHGDQLTMGMGYRSDTGFQITRPYNLKIFHQQVMHLTIKRKRNENSIILINNPNDLIGRMCISLFDSTHFISINKEQYHDPLLEEQQE